jgi:hypothetical protein
MPDTVTVRLRYGDTWNLSAGAATYATNAFNLGSCYDPDLTGAGGQPSGFDAWGALYARYKVHSTVMTVRFVNTCAQPVLAVVVAGGGTYHMPNSGSLVQQEFLEGQHSRGKLLNYQAYYGSTGTVVMRNNHSVLEGNDLKDIDYSALVTASPARAPVAAIFICNADGTTTAATATAVVCIEYLVTFYEKHWVIED